MPPIQMEYQFDYSVTINILCVVIAFILLIVQYVLFTSQVETVESNLEDYILALRDRVDALEAELYGTAEAEEETEAAESSNEKED
jgi:hypothetical protein